ncbi:MAG TPA: undecaprenyldiphospho-muramoylpentapeptide beta-N-acetylglucosaminyltransferase [Candidatus Krumholzibacteriaceae bacterium]|nr:undecaprenyldiphospho-muramoylpentapeptide beta-N-acetylglucosaminyltransferase [Candidatus Krumholzibacteriaceae bacterium]
MRIIFSGGGTGGHLYPALAVVDEIKARSLPLEALFVGTKAGMESKIVQKYGYDIKFISSRGMRGKNILGLVNTAFSLVLGIIQALVIRLRFKPDIVFGFGGYASAAVVIASSLSKCGVMLQEQNSIPGITNRVLSKLADRVYLGFESAGEYFKRKDNIVITGNPLRRTITKEYSNRPYESFGLKKNIPTLLVFGGSQGARSLNQAAVEYFLAGNNMQGIVQTGSRGYRWVKERIGEVEGVFVTDYIIDIRDAYQVADVALSRAGALSVSELAAVGIPSILVPYPHSVDEHQICNARFMADAGASVVIDDSVLDGKHLETALEEIIGNSERFEKMKRSALDIGVRDASRRIVDDMLGFYQRKSEGAAKKRFSFKKSK